MMRYSTAAVRLGVMHLACGAAACAARAQASPQPTPASSPQTTSQPGAASPAGTIDLRPKFRAGQTIRYLFDQTAKNLIKSQDPNDNTIDQDQKQTQRLGLVMKVVQAGDDGATIQVVYESIKVTLDTPDGVAEYDSTKPKPKVATPPATTKQPPARSTPGSKSPAAQPPAQVPVPNTDPLKDLADMDMNGSLALIVGPMVGTTITVKTDRTGAITSVTGGDALGGSIGGIGGLGGMGGMGGALVPSPSAIANWLVAGLGGPGNRGYARVGETWTNNDALSGTPVGSFNMKTTHTLKSANGGAANLSFVGAIEPSSSGAAPGAAIGQVQSANYTGSYVWDTRSGALAEMGTDMKVVLDVAAAGTKARMTSQTQVKVRRQ